MSPHHLNVEMVRKSIESVAMQVGEKVSTHPDSAEALHLELLPPRRTEFPPDEPPVEGGVVRGEDPPIDLRNDHPGNLLEGRSCGHHPVRDPCEALNQRGDRTSRIHQGREDCPDLPMLNLNHGDLGDPIALGISAPRRFDIDYGEAELVEGNRLGREILHGVQSPPAWAAQRA